MTHFVAQLKIEKVEKIEARGPRKPYEEAGMIESKREITEVTQMTLKGSTLEALIEKLGKHIRIIEED